MKETGHTEPCKEVITKTWKLTLSVNIHELTQGLLAIEICMLEKVNILLLNAIDDNLY